MEEEPGGYRGPGGGGGVKVLLIWGLLFGIFSGQASPEHIGKYQSHIKVTCSLINLLSSPQYRKAVQMYQTLEIK